MLAEEKNKQLSKEELLLEIERLKKELEEKKKLDYYKDLFDNSSEMIYIYSLDMVLIEMNDAVEKKLGYKREDLIGTNGDILSASGRNNYDQIRVKLEEIKRTREPFTHDWWVKSRDGNIFPTEFDLCFSNYNGEEVFILISRDISQRHQYEEELLKSRKQYKNLFDRNLAGIYRTKMNGEIVDCNHAFAAILGYDSKEELIGKVNAIDLYQDKEYRKKNIRKIIENQSVRSNRIRLLKKDKTPIWVLISTVAIKAKGNDSIDYMEGTFIDITDQVKMEEMLQKSQESYRLLLDSSPFGIVLHDEGKIIFTNKMAVEMMGISPEDDIHSLTFFDFISEIENASASSGISYKEYELKRKDGKQMSVEIKTNTIDFQGKNVSQVSIHDISQIKQLEKEKLQAKLVQDINESLTRELEEKTQIQNKLIASEEMLKASLMEKEVLLKEVHHRVKNNLQVISSIFNLQKNYSSNETVREILVESQNRIKSMAFIHESLYKTVDFARINFSEYAENLCYNLVKSYNSYGKTADLELKLQEVFLNLDFAIPCGLILNELITNAIKYAFEGKEEGTITVMASTEKQNVRMVIKDDGIGLPSNIDFKDSNTLGFQLVNALVTQINGKIKLTVENGTKYEILFALK